MSSTAELITVEQQLWDRSELFSITSRKTAREAILKIVSNVKLDILIVDPYLNSLDDLSDIFSLSKGLSIKVLLDVGRIDYPDEIQEAALKQAFDYDHVLEIRTMREDPKPIHDRFIFGDKHCWIVGSSLNHLGVGRIAFITNTDCLCEEENRYKKSEALRGILDRHWGESKKLVNTAEIK